MLLVDMVRRLGARDVCGPVQLVVGMPRLPGAQLYPSPSEKIAIPPSGSATMAALCAQLSTATPSFSNGPRGGCSVQGA